jgi:hypothetical protein
LGKTPPPKRGPHACPICDARNQPEAGATCPHYLGTVKKRELIWSAHAAEFVAAWTAVQDAVSGAHRNPQVVTAVLHSAVPSLSPEIRPVIESGVLLGDPFFWVDETEQTRVEIGDPPGGSAYAIYHAEPSFLSEVIHQMHRAAHWIATSLPDFEPKPRMIRDPFRGPTRGWSGT